MCPNSLLFSALLLASGSSPVSEPAAGATTDAARPYADTAAGAAAMPDIETNTAIAADAGNAKAAAGAETVAEIPNPAIDMAGFLSTAEAAAEHRRTHRVSEEEFLRLRAEPGTLVLDARSAARYAQLHVEGAVNLSFPDITVDSLAALAADKNTRILIYCNNNFSGAPEPFPTKMASASLNLSTFITLYDYGYRNVYELGPLVDVQDSRLPFAGSAMEELTLNEPDPRNG
jgi:hypothetical protein